MFTCLFNSLFKSVFYGTSTCTQDHLTGAALRSPLYPHILLLSLIAPGGGRGVVTLDLLNPTEVCSIPSPTHSSASREDVGTMAARAKVAEGHSSKLLELLSPFQLLYGDGAERLAARAPVNESTGLVPFGKSVSQLQNMYD